jgi:hypothetical protein
MPKLTTMALPVPPVGTSLNGSGEAYIASLQVYAECGEDNASIGTGTTGDVLEALLMAAKLRHLAFHPRTFAFSAFSMDGAKLVAALERNWSSIDASGPEVVDLADMLVVFGKRTRTVSFRQTN